MGKPIVMGRLTWESIGRPLPGRQNIVVTTQADYAAPGCVVVSAPELAIDVASPDDEIMIIGGSRIYAAFLPLASRIYLTRVHAAVDGDALFPALDPAQWRESASVRYAGDTANEHDFTFVTLDRIDKD